MKITEIVDSLQEGVYHLQRQIDEIKSYDDRLAHTILLTRQEAADFVGESLHQFDRDCNRYGIEKIQTLGGVRIRKSDLMRCMGLLSEAAADAEGAHGKMSDYEHLTGKYAKR